MQFTTVIALIASVAAVSAVPMSEHKGKAPAGEAAPTINNNGQMCEVNQKQSCCKTDSSGVLGGLLGGSCELNILGQNCGFQSACCQVDAQGSILGGSCAPIINL